MRSAKRKRLEAKGWKVGTADDFLDLTAEESQYIEIKLALTRTLKKLRLKRGHVALKTGRVDIGQVVR